MTRPRFTIRALIVAVAVVGFDVAAMSRAVRQGRLAHDVTHYAVGFGLVLLLLHAVVFILYRQFANRPKGSMAKSLRGTPSPLILVFSYLTVVALAILSVLFLTSGRF